MLGSTQMSKMSDADLITSPFLFDLKRHFAHLSRLLYLEIIEYDINSTEYQTYFMIYKYDDNNNINDNNQYESQNNDERKYSKSISIESESTTHYINNIDTKLIIDKHGFINCMIYHKLLESIDDINILFDYIVTHNIHYIKSHNLYPPQFISYHQLLLFINHDRSLLSRDIRIIYDQLFISITHNRYNDILKHYQKNPIICSPQDIAATVTTDKNDQNFEFDKRIRDKIIDEEISTPIHKLFVPQPNQTTNHYNISSSMLIPWLNYITQPDDNMQHHGISNINIDASMENIDDKLKENQYDQLLLNLLLITMTFNILIDCVIFSYLIPISPFIIEEIFDKTHIFTILFYVSLIISSYQFGQFLGKIIFNKIINILSWIISSYYIVNMMIFIGLFTNILCQFLLPIAVYRNSVILILIFRFFNGFFNHQYYYFKIFITSPLFSKTVKNILLTKYKLKSIKQIKKRKLSAQSTSINDGKNGTSIISHNDSEPDLHFAFNPKTKTNVFDSSTNTQFKYSKWLHSIIANTLIITQIGCIFGLLYGAFTYKYGSFLFVSTFYGFICNVNASHSLLPHQDKFAVTCFILCLFCILSLILYSKFIYSKYGKLFVLQDEEHSITCLNTEQIISFLQKTLSNNKQSSSRCFHLYLASYILAKNLQIFDLEISHNIMESTFTEKSGAGGSHGYISRLNQSFSSISTVNKSPSKVSKMSPANKYFKYRNNANNRKIIKIRKQQQKTLTKQMKKNKKRVKMNLLKRKVKHLLLFTHFIIATMISWFDFGYLFVLYINSDKQGYNFNEIEISIILLVPYCTLIIWIPIGSLIFYKFMNSETKYYISSILLFSILFISSTFISTFLLHNNNVYGYIYYTWIFLIILRIIMTILLSTILAMIDYKLHQLLLTYSVIVMQIDHVDYFSMSISLIIFVLLIFGIDKFNFCDKYLFSVTYCIIVCILLVLTFIPYIVSEMILYGRFSNNNNNNNNGMNSYKLMTQSYRTRKKKWRTKINTLQNYVYIRSLLSHYDRTPNTTPSLTLALQHVKIKKKKKKKSRHNGPSQAGASISAISSEYVSEYVITQPKMDVNEVNIQQNGINYNDDFALIFSSTSHTNYTNIEYMDANMTPSLNNNNFNRKQTFSGSNNNNQTPYINGYKEKETADDILDDCGDDDAIIEKQQDREQSFKLAQQIMNIAAQDNDDMKININTLKTIQISGLDIGINEPDKYISDIDCIIAGIISLYNQYLRYYSINDRFLMEGRLHFDGSLRQKIKKGKPIHLIYIGFTFKCYSFDDDNSADYEYLSGVDVCDLFILHRLNEFCQQINEIYAYKSYCSIISMAPFIMDLIYDKNYNIQNKKIITKNIKFCELIMNYYFNLGKMINDGNKEDDLFEYLEWYNILTINDENKYKGDNYMDTDTEDENKMDGDDNIKILNKYKNLIESFSLQNKLFSSTIFNALKSNNNLKQIFLKLNDWVNMLPVNMLFFNHRKYSDKNNEIEIINEKVQILLKSYLRLLVYCESQLKYSLIFNSMPMNNECSSIIFSSFQSCKLGFTASLFSMNNEKYKLDKLNYYNCYGSNQMIFIIDDCDNNDDNTNISFIPLNVLNLTDFEWKKIKISNDIYEYIIFSLDGSLKFKMMKLSNIRNKYSKICNRILKNWKLKQCVFDINEYYCLQMQHTK